MIAWIWFALATLFSYVQQGQTALSSPAPPPPPVTYQNVSLASFPVRVYGLEDLAPPVNGTVPPVTVAIYMHGRFESADIADPLVRSLYASTRQHMVADPAGSLRDFLLVSFDALNHGARTRDPARRFDLPQNPTFLIDHYGYILNNRDMVSFIIDFLPVYLFPNDERSIERWVISGESMGGHSAWHALAADRRIDTAAIFLGSPDYNMIMQDRAQTAHMSVAPPTAPLSFQRLVNVTDPSMKPFNSMDPAENPFWGKHIFLGLGGDDPFVPLSLSARVLRGLVLGSKNDTLAQQSLEIYEQPGIQHAVTPQMLDLAGRWIYRWTIAKQPVTLPGPAKLPSHTMSAVPATVTAKP